MSTDYHEPEDVTAGETFLQVEQNADLIRALNQLYSEAGSEPLAVLALRYGFGFSVADVAFIMNRPKGMIQNTLQECLHFLKQKVS